MKSYSDDLPDAEKINKNQEEIKGMLTIILSNQVENNKRTYRRLVWNSILLLGNLTMTAVLALILAGIL